MLPRKSQGPEKSATAKVLTYIFSQLYRRSWNIIFNNHTNPNYFCELHSAAEVLKWLSRYKELATVLLPAGQFSLKWYLIESSQYSPVNTIWHEQWEAAGSALRQQHTVSQGSLRLAGHSWAQTGLSAIDRSSAHGLPGLAFPCESQSSTCKTMVGKQRVKNSSPS